MITVKIIPENRNSIPEKWKFRKTLKSGIVILILFLVTILQGCLVQSKRLLQKADEVSSAFAKKASEGTVYKFKVDTIRINPETKTLKLEMNPVFTYIPFRPENTSQYYNCYTDLLGRKFRGYSVSIESMGKDISELIPNYYRENSVKLDSSRLVKSPGTVIPIVRNTSKNLTPSNGLSDRNIALWHSHGWYYENTLDRWEWQRARDFLTVEDIWTMSFVVPYITPMLENAGANVFLPRERDIPVSYTHLRAHATRHDLVCRLLLEKKKKKK